MTRIITLIFLFYICSFSATAKSKYTDSVLITGFILDKESKAPNTAIITARVKEVTLGYAVLIDSSKFCMKVAIPKSKEFGIYVRGFGYYEQKITTLISPKTTVVLDTIILKYPMPPSPVIINHTCPPMIDKYSGGNTKTITSEEIESMPH